jgi:hypothetical protein
MNGAAGIEIDRFEMFSRSARRAGKPGPGNNGIAGAAPRSRQPMLSVGCPDEIGKCGDGGRLCRTWGAHAFHPEKHAASLVHAAAASPKLLERKADPA